MRIEVKTRPLWPLAAAVIAALAIWLWAAQGAGEDRAVDVDLAGEDEEIAHAGGAAACAAGDGALAGMDSMFNTLAEGTGAADGGALAGMDSMFTALAAGTGVAEDGASDASAPASSDSMFTACASAYASAPPLADSMFTPCAAERCAPDTDGRAGAGDISISVYDHRRDRVLNMRLEEYIYRVTASEMPARCEPEALKAQAVAARTYACLKLCGGGCGRGGADICTDSGHCQAYRDAAALRAGWGDAADSNERKVRAAVEATQGLILTYEGRPINALFHASSGGHTEDVENVYSEALPYLRGVDSPGEEQYSGYRSQRRFTAEEFCRIAAGLSCTLTEAPLDEQVEVAARTQAGQVAVLRVGEGALTGRQARKAFGLRSQCFEVTVAGGEVTFDVRGFGHGVGMSQNGADAMARAGAGFDEILTHYYTGVEIAPMGFPALARASAA
ncbi:MAG: stage II sporulation protein D [Candidatus Fimadaptatus sp.]